MILDADLTMPPEQLPKFWRAISDGRGEFINGSRLVYRMEDGAMRFLNLIANRIFSVLFTWLLAERITDTLCGTKVLRRSDYARLTGDARANDLQLWLDAGTNPATIQGAILMKPVAPKLRNEPKLHSSMPITR